MSILEVLLKPIVCALMLVIALMTVEDASAELATYYADSYAGGTTASGDIYDPGAFTAAHPNPAMLGTYAEVCDIDNCVKVYINDVCACGIDLSAAAAAALFPLDQGVAEVSIYPL